jgi:hypothetical protein
MLISAFLTSLSLVTFLFSASEDIFINEEPDQQRQKKKAWTFEEDRLLVSTVKEFGTKNWSKIAECINGRSSKQCRERFINHLDSTINKADFSVEEKELLDAKIGEYTPGQIPWVEIATSFRAYGPDGKIISRRTDLQLRNHYHSQANKSLRKSGLWKDKRNRITEKFTEEKDVERLSGAKRQIDISSADITPAPPTQPFPGQLLLTGENISALTFSADRHQAITSEEASEEKIEKVKKPRLRRIGFTKKQSILPGIEIPKDIISISDTSWEKTPPVKSAGSSNVEHELVANFPSPLIPIDFTNHDINEYTNWLPKDPDLLALLARPLSPSLEYPGNFAYEDL